MRKVFRILLSGGWALLVCASYTLAQGDFQWRGSLSPGQTIEIKGTNGTVHAGLSTSGQVEVTATRSAQRSNPADVRIEVVPHSGGVTICAVYPAAAGREPNTCQPGAGGHSSTRDNDTNVRFEVRVPAGVDFAGRTVNGNVEAESLQSDSQAQTVNGSVKLTTTGRATATTVNGSVSVELGRADWPDGATFKTVNGGITLTLPGVVDADLQAETVNGSVTSDFPITVTGAFNRRTLRGRIGSGGQRSTEASSC